MRVHGNIRNTSMFMSKRWDPKLEVKLLEKWEEEGLYKFDKRSSKPIFSIDCPPPYASGPWHIGGAVHYSQIDMIARYFRMKGYEVLFPFGIDRNGLPVEVEVEKEHGISASMVPREDFLSMCREFLDKAEKEILQIARRLGMSCDFKAIYRTDSPEYRAITQSTFIKLWKDGLIYEAERPSNWCPVCKTTIADAEVEYEEFETDLCYIRFKLWNDDREIIVATTRPELLCSCQAILFHPLDERYEELKAREAIVPIYGKRVPILPHTSVKPEFGTGIVMACSFGDYRDIRVFRELGLKPAIAINSEGKMNELAGPYAGLTVIEARKRIIDDLKKDGILIKVERIKHRVPVCWRTKNPIEFISTKEFYLKQLMFIDSLKELINCIEFYPPESKNVLIDWINSLSSDWPISRRRYYGTEIPIWYCKQCGKAHLPEPGRYYQPWKEKAPFKKCECGSTSFIGEDRVFDTWFDSSISQLFILGYQHDDELFKKSFPCSLRPQGIDIVRTWLYYSLLRTYQLFKTYAFKKVRISGMGLDEKGRAMHKSRGNVIYPQPILDKYGADALRLWGCLEARLGSNYRFSEERVAACKRFLTKLWNIALFVSQFPYVKDGFELSNVDKMMLALLNDLIKECERGYESMDLFIPSTSIVRFTWKIMADHYIECVKPRAYNADREFSEELQKGAWYTLHTCLRNLLILLAPICPFISDQIWRHLFKESIHLQAFPEPKEEWESELKHLLKKFVMFNRSVWKYKKGRGISLAEGIKVAFVPKELMPFEEDLKAMHKIEEMHFEEVEEARFG